MQQPRFQAPPQPPSSRPPVRPPARPQGLGRGCRTALFVTLGVMLVLLLGIGGVAAFLLGNTMGTFDKYHKVPAGLDGTIVTAADVQRLLPAAAEASCPPSSDTSAYCQWRADEEDGGAVVFTVSLYVSSGKLLQSGAARVHAAYDEARGAYGDARDVSGLGEHAYIGTGTSDDGERDLEFIDDNLDAKLTYTVQPAGSGGAAPGNDAALIAVGRAVASRVAGGR